jgi:hypothetical protein
MAVCVAAFRFDSDRSFSYVSTGDAARMVNRVDIAGDFASVGNTQAAVSVVYGSVGAG